MNIFALGVYAVIGVDMICARIKWGLSKSKSQKTAILVLLYDIILKKIIFDHLNIQKNL